MYFIFIVYYLLKNKLKNNQRVLFFGNVLKRFDFFYPVCKNFCRRQYNFQISTVQNSCKVLARCRKCLRKFLKYKYVFGLSLTDKAENTIRNKMKGNVQDNNQIFYKSK